MDEGGDKEEGQPVSKIEAIRKHHDGGGLLDSDDIDSLLEHIAKLERDLESYGGDG